MAHPEQRPEGAVLVADVFDLGLLRKAGIEVIAGDEGLSREVTWVHSGEIGNIATFLRGGELLLTAGTGIGRHPGEQRAYVERLADAGASGLVLELGMAFDQVPQALRATAERRGLPTGVLHSVVPFAEVTRTVHGWILGRADEVRDRAQRIAEEFNELLLSGGSLEQVVHKVHELTGKPTVLEDAAHQVIEYAGEKDEMDAIISDWGTHSRLGHRVGATGSGIVAGDDEPALCAYASVVLRGEVWGRLHVLRSLRPIYDIDRLAVERASSAVGLALLTSQQDARLAERARADFLAEATRRAPGDPNAFLRQAKSLGADLRGCALVAASVAGAEENPALATVVVAEAFGEASLPVLSSPDSGHLLIGVPADRQASAVRDVGEAVCTEADGSLTVGLSRPTDVIQVARAFHEADECLRFGRVSKVAGVLEYATLGLHLLLATLADQHELSVFIEAELGPLLDHDAKARSPLRPTLEALLAHGNNRAEAARALHVERRSLYYRIGRLEEVLGKPLDDYNMRLGLGVALRALNLMEDRVKAVELAARRAGT